MNGTLKRVLRFRFRQLRKEIDKANVHIDYFGVHSPQGKKAQEALRVLRTREGELISIVNLYAFMNGNPEVTK